jgi:ABC-type bacteriocin/lantibiotic exporter with double-glycine peptidase domain
MPLSDHEQRILDDIERRLAEEDPRLVEQVGRTTLSAHLARRIRLAALAFIVGGVMLFLIAVSIWLPLIGFSVMAVATFFAFRYVKQLGRDQMRALQEDRRFSVAAILARMATRFRRPPESPNE